MKKQTTIYLAASLFNGRENLFNLNIVERLEKKGYKIKFPQRDGFEFGRLSEELEKQIQKKETENACQEIIYYLDMGIFIPKSDVVLANLDEPQDEGVMIEISYAKIMNKVVVGYRTDIRSPYGTNEDKLRGIHFFPAFQCDYFIKSYQPCRTKKEREQGLNNLTTKIDEILKKEKILRNNDEKYSWKNPNIQKTLKNAEILFKGIENIHSKKGLETIVKRYIENKNILKRIYPKIENS